MMTKIPISLKLLNTRISFKANSSRIIIEMSRKYDVKSPFGFFCNLATLKYVLSLFVLSDA